MTGRRAANRRWLLPVAVLLLVAGGAGTWAYTTHREVQQTGVKVYKALEDDGMPLRPGVLDDPVFRALPAPAQPPSLGRYIPPKDQPAAAGAPTPGPFIERDSSAQLAQRKVHILLIGNDQPALGSGRGDTLLSLTFDPVAKTLYFLSIPRDTRVELPGHGLVKINAAYAYGGASLQTTAVERFLGVPFDKYVEVSLNGFVQAIDAVGGVDVDSSLDFELDGQHITRGRLHLEGEQALAYARMRHDDPEGDLGRNARQQQVVRALMRALGGLDTPELTKVLDRLSDSVRTNFSPSEVVKLRAAHAYMLDHQTGERVRGENRKIGGVWYYVVSDRERQRLNLLLR
jgi:LCP family protein required for cell wall assembly